MFTSKITKVLSILLIVQIGILFLMNSRSSVLSVDSSSTEFVKLDLSSIHKIKFEQPDKALEIDKTETGWALPASNNFPASLVKVEKLIKDLNALKATSPVATSLSAAKKLKTGGDDYEKKVTFKSTTGEEIIFFGNSPTFKKLYARVNGSDNTYIVDYQPTELVPNPNNWFNQDLLKIQRSDLEKVDFQDLKLEKQDGVLKVMNLTDTQKVEDKELQGFLNKLTEITYSELPELNSPAGWEAAATVVSYDLVVKGEKQTYLVKGPTKVKVGEQEKEKYFLKASNQNYYFELSKYEVDALTAFSLARVVKEEKADQAADTNPTID